MTTVPACASSCGLVSSLLAQLAQARGMTVRMVAAATGILSDQPAPQQVFACGACGREYPSQRAAEACTEFDYQR